MMNICDNAVIIGAHPDDEMLWFTSIVRKADKLIIVYKDFWGQPGLGERRAEAIAKYPHDNVVFLALEEPGSFGRANWSNPVPDAFGLAFSSAIVVEEAKRKAKQTLSYLGARVGQTAPAPIRTLYENSYLEVKEALRSQLTAKMNVFTHNPWGEYGHEDHVLVHRVVADLAKEIGFHHWMSNYCSERALPLAMRYFQMSPHKPVCLPADIDYANRIKKLYLDHKCWTWTKDWAWFETEHFLPAPPLSTSNTALRHLFPLNFFAID